MLNLSVIKNLKIVVSSVNVHGVRQVKVLDSVKAQEGEDLVVDYLIPSKTESIQIELRATLLEIETNTEFEANQTRKIILQSAVSRMFDLYLK